MRDLTREDWDRLGKRQFPSIQIIVNGREVARCGINSRWIQQVRGWHARSIVVAECFEGGVLFL
jgi:hypothetical protein